MALIKKHLLEICNGCIIGYFYTVSAYYSAKVIVKKMKTKIFEFIKKADFVLVFFFALLGIIALGSALINDLLPFHRTRAQQIAVVEDIFLA